MIALCVALVALLAGSLGLNGWLTFKTIRKVETGADVSIALGATEAELERVKGENAALSLAADESHRMAQHLAEELKDALTNTAPVGAGVAADDVAARLRNFRRYEEARIRSGPDPLPREAAPSVPARAPSVADGGPPAATGGTR